MSAYPRIFWQNRCEGITPTVTGGGVTTGYPAVNACDWRPWLQYRATGANSYTFKIDAGAAVSANAVILAVHTIFSEGGANARFKLNASTDDFSGSDEAIVAYTDIDSDSIKAVCFTQVSYQYWNITIDNNGGAAFDLQIGNVFIGNYLEFPQHVSAPFAPDHFKSHNSRNRGETGQLLGVSEDWKELIFNPKFKGISKTWYDDTFKPALDSFYLKQFYWAWAFEDRPTEIYLVAFNTDDYEYPIDKTFRSIDLHFNGVAE